MIGIVLDYHEDTKFRQNPSLMTVIIILAHDNQGILQVHPVHEGRTVNAAYYKSFLQYNRTLRRNLPALLNNALILHDNAKRHTVACVQKRRGGWEILQQPLYSPDFSRCVFDLTPKSKTPLRGKLCKQR